ncbi:MAG: hypothetical protein WBR26_13630 [Candidatus Acidiferrum sp.]
MLSSSAPDLIATELLCSFILNAAGATLVAIRRHPAGRAQLQARLQFNQLRPDEKEQAQQALAQPNSP